MNIKKKNFEAKNFFEKLEKLNFNWNHLLNENLEFIIIALYTFVSNWLEKSVYLKGSIILRLHMIMFWMWKMHDFLFYFFFLLSSSIFNATIYQITVIWFIFYLCFAFYMKLKWREECNRCNKIVVRQTNDVERIYWELVEEDDNEKKILKRAYVVPLCVSVVYVHQAHHEHIFGIRIIMRIFINMSWGAFHLWFHYFF